MRWTATIAGSIVLLIVLYNLRWARLLSALQMLTCVLLVTTILLQSGKGGGLGALGGMSDQSFLGARSSAALRHVTFFLMGVFMLCTMLLVRMPQGGAPPAPPPPAPMAPAPLKPASASKSQPAEPAPTQPASKAGAEK